MQRKHYTLVSVGPTLQKSTERLPGHALYHSRHDLVNSNLQPTGRWPRFLELTLKPTEPPDLNVDTFLDFRLKQLFAYVKMVSKACSKILIPRVHSMISINYPEITLNLYTFDSLGVPL